VALLVPLGAWTLDDDALAQSSWKPSKPVQLGNHGNPGTSADTFIRNIIETVKQEKIVSADVNIQQIYKPGGSSAVLQTFMQTQKGNEHLLAQWTTTWIGASLSSPDLKVSLKDLTPLVRLITEPTVVVVNSASPFKSMKEMIDKSKAEPNKLRQVGGSVTSVDNIFRVLLMNATGAKWDYIPSAGGGERIAAILGGNADIYLAQTNEVSEYVRAGKMRILSSLTDQRQEEIPDVPTIKEAGIHIPLLVTSRGIVAPPGISKPAETYWIDVFSRLSKAPRWHKFLKENGLTGGFLSGPELKAFLDQQFETMNKIMTESGMIKKPG
jgi:putative tricarboxylic transport membrane protein